MSVRISLGSAFQKRGPMVDIRAGGVTRSEAEHHLCVREGVQLSGNSVGLGGAQRWKYLVHRYFKEVLWNLISCH